MAGEQVNSIERMIALHPNWDGRELGGSGLPFWPVNAATKELLSCWEGFGADTLDTSPEYMVKDILEVVDELLEWAQAAMQQAPPLVHMVGAQQDVLGQIIAGRSALETAYGKLDRIVRELRGEGHD